MRFIPLLAVPLLVAGCVPAAAPPPAPVSPARPVALPPPAPLAADWRDWPRTPGDWRYGPAGNGTAASYVAINGAPLLSLACNRATRQVTLSVTGHGAATITVRTTSTIRTLPVVAHADARPPVTLDATLAATDPLLDAMAFSRGRFTVEQAGRPPLVLPSWAEVGRTIEDCR